MRIKIKSSIYKVYYYLFCKLLSYKVRTNLLCVVIQVYVQRTLSFDLKQ